MASAWSSENLTDENESSWKYRGEGAANVVVAYTGPDKDLAGKVLRIQKAGTKKDRPHNQSAHFDLNAQKHRTDRGENYDGKVEAGSANGSPPQHHGLGSGQANGVDSAPLVVETEKSEPTLPKQEVAAGPLLEPLEQEIWEKYPTVAAAKTAVELVHEYTRHVMGPFLGEPFVDPGVREHLRRPISKSFSALSRTVWVHL